MQDKCKLNSCAKKKKKKKTYERVIGAAGVLVAVVGARALAGAAELGDADFLGNVWKAAVSSERMSSARPSKLDAKERA